MYSGITGAAVVSGDIGVTSAPTYQLIEDVMKVIKELEASTPALFDTNARQRPCGLLDKYTAYAQLMGDVLGLPLIPWTLGEPIGKKAAKLPGELPAARKTAKKRAKRQGKDPAAAVAAVARRRVNLEFPTPAQISAAVRQLAKQAAQKAAPPELPEQPPPEQPLPSPEPEPSPAKPNLAVPEAVIQAALSDAGSKAIYAAWGVIAYEREIAEGNDCATELKVAEAMYAHLLKQLQRANPGKFEKSFWSRPQAMVQLSITLVSQGVSVPAAERGAEMAEIDLEAMAAMAADSTAAAASS